MTGEDQERLREITDWFENQGFLLGFDQVGGEWAVAAIPIGVRIGVARTASGATKLDAAEALFKIAQKGEMAGVIAKNAAANTAPTATTAGAESAMGIDSTRVGRHPNLDRVLAHFEWSFMFTNQPDGSRSYIIADAKTGDVLRWGKEDQWDDVLLAAITDLYPPSAESLAG